MQGRGCYRRNGIVRQPWGTGQGASGIGDSGMDPWGDPEVMPVLPGGDGCPGKQWVVVLGQNPGF